MQEIIIRVWSQESRIKASWAWSHGRPETSPPQSAGPTDTGRRRLGKLRRWTSDRSLAGYDGRLAAIGDRQIWRVPIDAIRRRSYNHPTIEKALDAVLHKKCRTSPLAGSGPVVGASGGRCCGIRTGGDSCAAGIIKETLCQRKNLCLMNWKLSASLLRISTISFVQNAGSMSRVGAWRSAGGRSNAPAVWGSAAYAAVIFASSASPRGMSSRLCPRPMLRSDRLGGRGRDTAARYVQAPVD